VYLSTRLLYKCFGKYAFTMSYHTIWSLSSKSSRSKRSTSTISLNAEWCRPHVRHLFFNRCGCFVHSASRKRHPLLSTRTSYPCFSPPRMKSGSHAEASVPIGGYLCPSCSIRGPHVHHCSDGTLDITPATCLPQPHQVVLSGMC
jgi:hypothetical protein